MSLFASSRRVFIVGIPLFAACTWGWITGCEDPTLAGPWVDFSPASIAVAAGEQTTIGVSTNGYLEADTSTCRGIADVSFNPLLVAQNPVAIRGLAPGDCVVGFTATITRGVDEKEHEEKSAPVLLHVTVTAPAFPEAGPPSDAGAGDAGAGDAGKPPICVTPVAKVATQGDRDLYMAYTDLDSGQQGQTCPVHTSTDFRGDITFSFLAGSPGYSISGRGNYEILTAVPAKLENIGATSAADALEEDLITITFRKRIFADEDAATPPTWTMTFRMTADPDPAKWTVDLYDFAKLP